MAPFDPRPFALGRRQWLLGGHWANLLAMAAGFGVTAAVLLWPALATRRGR